MEKEFVSYEIALALKELGFDEPCIKYYWTDGMFTKTYESPFNHNKRDNSISAPLYQQAFRWFREKYFGVCEILRKEVGNHSEFMGWIYIEGQKIDVISYRGSKTYEEVELECLKKLIEIVKRKN